MQGSAGSRRGSVETPSKLQETGVMDWGLLIIRHLALGGLLGLRV